MPWTPLPCAPRSSPSRCVREWTAAVRLWSPRVWKWGGGGTSPSLWIYPSIPYLRRGTHASSIYARFVCSGRSLRVSDSSPSSGGCRKGTWWKFCLHATDPPWLTDLYALGNLLETFPWFLPMCPCLTSVQTIYHTVSCTWDTSNSIELIVSGTRGRISDCKVYALVQLWFPGKWDIQSPLSSSLQLVSWVILSSPFKFCLNLFTIVYLNM